MLTVSLVLALVPALAYAQAVNTETVLVINAQTTVNTLQVPQRFVTRTIVFTAPVEEASAIADAIPKSIQLLETQVPGGYLPITINGFSTSFFIPAAASVPTGVPLPITPVLAPAPLPTELAAVSSISSRNVAIVSSITSDFNQLAQTISSLASQASSPPTLLLSIPNPSSQISNVVSSIVSVASSNVAQATSAVSAASSRVNAAGSALVTSVISGVTTQVLVATSALSSQATASSGLVTSVISSTASTSVAASGTTTASRTTTVASTSAAASSGSTAAPSSAVAVGVMWQSYALALISGYIITLFLTS